jgi:GTP-binding protein
MQAYFEQRQSLRGVVLVMDIRHPLRPFDEQMLAWCTATGVPCHVLLTKADKLNRGPAQATLLQVRKTLPPGATAQVFSAHNREGLDELIDRLDVWYGLAQPPLRAEPGSAGGVGAADPTAANG